MKMYAIYDKKLEAYMQPFFGQSNGAAIRAFGDSVKEQGSPANKHPEDYNLHFIGEFDEDVGTLIQPKDFPQQIATAQQFAE